MMIPFHKPYISGNEFDYVQKAIRDANFSDNGPWLRECKEGLEMMTGRHAMLTPSCTDALEMSAILANIQPGDEVIMPSFTFVSSANPFVLRGAKIIFVDIDPDTMNMDPVAAGRAITNKTKAIVVTHYGGVAADMYYLRKLCEEHRIYLIEDAAHCIGAYYQEQHLGGIGHMGAMSFHQTKNIHCSEGGALFVRDTSLWDRANILRDKGTNRQQFLEGRTERYSWVDIGSSYALSELNAAFLAAQLQDVEMVNQERLTLWARYQEALQPIANSGKIRLAKIPDYAVHNGHVFYFLCQNQAERSQLIQFLKERDVVAQFHYVPLHSAPAGLRFGEFRGEDRFTTDCSQRLLRLPLFAGLTEAEQSFIIDTVLQFYGD
jgi:dTDP-4-amino-4,6-dideoxygalactose transaminase